MCGICGFWSSASRERGNWEGILQDMVDVLAHRGPDDQGLVLCSHDGGMVGLGHRRLSIIDLSRAGRQPMSDEADEVFLVFNGEIYNFPELRRELEGKGHRFRSRSDTEVIIRAYLEYGLDVFEKLDGMFALALWDNRRRRLVLARDPFGKKPLFYYRNKDQWIFASELKSILKHPDFEGRLDHNALENYLFFGYLPSPGSIFEHVGKVKPSHFLVVENGSSREVPYWRITFRSGSPSPSLGEAKERFLDLFDRAVSKRLISDVPLGVLLSGGLDSTVVAAITKRVSREPVTTFSIGFEEDAFNELPYALRASSFLGMENIHMVVGQQELIDTVEKLPDLADEPLADSSLIPFHCLSRMTRQHVKVALGGDGADELLAGYPTYPLHGYMNMYDAFPRWARRPFEGMVGLIPASFANYNLEYGLKKFIMGSGHAPGIRHFIWMSYVPPGDLDEVLQNRLLSKDELFSSIGEKLLESDAVTDAEKAFYLNLRMYLPDSILAKVDRASMSSALEVRAPFLDKALAEFLISLPASMKLEHLRGKKILRKAVRGLVPKEVIKRPKKGFTPPMARWINGDLRELVDDLLGPQALRSSGLFREKGVGKLLEDHRKGRRDNWRQIWALLVFQLWRNKYL